PVEALDRLPVDRVSRLVGAVADLQGRDAGRVAREREPDELHLQLGDLFDRAVLAEGAPRVHRLDRLSVEPVGRAGLAHLDHGLLHVADALEMDVEALAVGLAELGTTEERLHLLANDVVHAVATEREQVRTSAATRRAPARA